METVGEVSLHFQLFSIIFNHFLSKILANSLQVSATQLKVDSVLSQLHHMQKIFDLILCIFDNDLVCDQLFESGQSFF